MGRSRVRPCVPVSQSWRMEPSEGSSHKGGFRILSSGRSTVKKGRALDAAGPWMLRGLRCYGPQML